MDPADAALKALAGGLYALQDYVAYHVLTCLIPAFLLAGAITVFLSRDSIIRYMGSTTRKLVSFPLAAASGMGLAVCSCTVIPISAGLYRKGSSIGPAFIMLWTAPATNILALVYTGTVLGLDMALVRAAAAVSTAVIVGLVMVAAFRADEAGRAARQAKLQGGAPRAPIVRLRALILLALLAATLLAPNYLGAGRPYLPDKVVLFALPMAATLIYAWRALDRTSIKEWLRESLWFARMIFPLLLAGVFVVGVVGSLLPEEWVRAWLGGSSLQSAFLATLIGAVSYFATLTEAPFVHTLMSLGMGKGPALGLLLAGPGLSMPSMIAIARIFGSRKALTYVLTSVALATAIAYLAGNLLWST